MKFSDVRALVNGNSDDNGHIDNVSQFIYWLVIEVIITRITRASSDMSQGEKDAIIYEAVDAIESLDFCHYPGSEVFYHYIEDLDNGGNTVNIQIYQHMYGRHENIASVSTPRERLFGELKSMIPR